MSGDYLIVPPFFPFQCPIVRNLVSNKHLFIDCGYIVFPLRESSLDAFFDKKRNEYRNAKDVYNGIYRKDAIYFLKNRNPQIIKRDTKVGISIANAWEAAPDVSTSWNLIKEDLISAEIDKLRKIPTMLKENDSAVTWSAMRAFLENYKVLSPGKIELLGTKLDEAIQHQYIKMYLIEFNSTIISRIPPKTTDLFLKSTNISYDYMNFRRILEVLNLWNYICKLNDKELIRLKMSASFNRFMITYEKTCIVYKSFDRVFELFLNATTDQTVRDLLLYTDSRIIGISNYFISFTFVCDLLESVRVKVDKMLEESKNTNQKENHINFGEFKVKKVFLVHGKNENVKNKIHVFLTNLGLNVVVMENIPNIGRTLPEKFEQLARECDYAVIIGTGDDSFLNGGKTIVRVRQNVLIEIGFFWGLFGRSNGKLSILIDNDKNVEIPTDLSGLGYIPITSDLGETKNQLQIELKNANII